MSSIWSGVIDWAYVITLEGLTARQASIPSRLKAAQLGDISSILTMQRHPDGGSAGCYDSHVKTVLQAQREGRRTVLILEDDFEFTPDFDMYVPFIRTFVNTAPRDSWDFLMLGLMPIGKSSWTGYEHIAHIECAVQSHAYIVNLESPLLQEGIQPNAFNPSSKQTVDNRLFCKYMPYSAMTAYFAEKSKFENTRLDGIAPPRYRVVALKPMIVMQAYDGTSSASELSKPILKLVSKPRFMRAMHSVSFVVTPPTYLSLCGVFFVLLVIAVLTVPILAWKARLKAQ